MKRLLDERLKQHRAVRVDGEPVLRQALADEGQNIELSAEGALDSNTGLGNSGYINGGRARSDGVELSTEWRPLPRLSLSASAAYDDAVLTQSLPPLTEPLSGNPGPGTRLPLTARFTGNLGAQYEAPLSDGTSGFAGAQYSYVGGSGLCGTSSRHA